MKHEIEEGLKDMHKMYIPPDVHEWLMSLTAFEQLPINAKHAEFVAREAVLNIRRQVDDKFRSQGA